MGPEGGSVFLLGFCDGPGEWLSHRLLARVKGENGPYAVSWISCDAGAQLIELLSVLKRLSDQLRQMKIAECLDSDGWSTIGGDCQLWLGQRSEVTRAPPNHGLPALRVGAGVLSSMWIGSQVASSIALTNHLESPTELPAVFDEALRLPAPLHCDWEF